MLTSDNDSFNNLFSLAIVLSVASLTSISFLSSFSLIKFSEYSLDAFLVSLSTLDDWSSNSLSNLLVIFSKNDLTELSVSFVLLLIISNTSFFVKFFKSLSSFLNEV